MRATRGAIGRGLVAEIAAAIRAPTPAMMTPATRRCGVRWYYLRGIRGRNFFVLTA
jgi:hypothetical protein